MRRPVFKNLGLLVFALGIASRSDAGTIIFPPGLQPGDQFRLVFVTSTSRDATSTDINDYNLFVSNVANSVPALAALNATWKAIASASAGNITAESNISDLATAPVYRLDGLEVASTQAALFDACCTSLLNPIRLDENGQLQNQFVWTGTNESGGIIPANPLGSPGPTVGAPTSVDGTWLNASSSENNVPRQFYAISSALTVPTPEPATIGLSALGMAILLLLARARRQ
jgi:hypothetical protein